MPATAAPQPEQFTSLAPKSAARRAEAPVEPPDPAALEAATIAMGRKIFALADRQKTDLFSAETLRSKMLELMMKDENLRYRMLRFTDVYVALKSSRAVAQHLVEYLESPALEVGLKPTPLLALARRGGRIGAYFPAVTDWATRQGTMQMARHFIAGDKPAEVAQTIRRTEAQGFMFSLDLLGEFVASERQADDFAGRYEEMVARFGRVLGAMPRNRPQAVRACGPRVNVSIKLSSLTSKFEPADPEGTSAAVRERLRPLFRAAVKSGAFINVDMEKFEYRALTLRILRDLLSEPEFRGFPNVGTVAQAYLRDADTVLSDFLDWAVGAKQPITIRLVKGAYWDSEQIWARSRRWPIPVLLHKHETDAMYERCLGVLLPRHSQGIRTAIASHNVRSIAHGLALAKALRVPEGRYECQVLFGMAGPFKEALRRMGVPVRIYTPCGDLLEGMAYLVRRILENTSNESFLRLRFTEGAAVEALLKNPARAHLPG
ncbi:MAG: proline dehydrogenase family protein [Candidatus Sumerlaeia bacterium]|nr:proline dehydrogenase family protein [Candidatus Sumerlaeia bacterium]